MGSQALTSVPVQASVRRVQRGCALALMAIALAAWIGWATGLRVLAATRPMYMPMAPNTALCFFNMAIALAILTSRHELTPRVRVGVAATLAGIVGVIGLARVVESLTRLELGVDRWFFLVPTEMLGLAPVGKMSLLTALAFVVASLGLILLTGQATVRLVRDAAGMIGLVVIALGTTFLLGYLFDAPLLYGGPTIPMALNTALSFVLLGTGIVAEAGTQSFPLRSLRGPSVHARLLREFLPFVSVLVFLVAWLIHGVTINVGDRAAALSSALAAVLAILLAGVICSRIARRVGGQLERAEQALQRAHQELEGRVTERTRELQMAKELLEERNRELQISAVELETRAASVRLAHQELQAAHHDLQKAESQLVESETLSAIGKMVAGVAHEINNPLAFVTNNVAVLQRDVGHLQSMLSLYQEAEGTLALHQRELLSRIRDLGEQIDLAYVLDHLGGMMVQSRDGLKRIQQIVKGLRDFARIDESELKEVDLNHGIASTVEIMRPLSIQQRVALETDLETLPPVTCFAAKINQVVLNLLVNAIDASPPGGLVTVRSRSTTGGVMIDVIDEGCGIDPAIRDKIFAPFFTTKAIGKGTGLGLSISYGIVRSQGGRIDVESTPGKGSRFTIHLPFAPASSPPRADRPEATPTPALAHDRDGETPGRADRSGDDESRQRAASGRDDVA